MVSSKHMMSKFKFWEIEAPKLISRELVKIWRYGSSGAQSRFGEAWFVEICPYHVDFTTSTSMWLCLSVT